MKHQLVGDLDTMLQPAFLSSLGVGEVTRVRCSPFMPEDSTSGSQFLLVETTGSQPCRYMVKRTSKTADWIMRATMDNSGREMTVWRDGLLDRLPLEIISSVKACSEDGDGWAMLMSDVTSELAVLRCSLIESANNVSLCAALAALHAQFWEDPALHNSSLGLCSSMHLFTTFSPATGSRERAGNEATPKRLQAGWELLSGLTSTNLASSVLELLSDPAPICVALGRFPHTLTHGDYRLANLGIRRGQRTQIALLDWHFAGREPPAIDIAWYIATSTGRLPRTKDETISCYRANLASRLGRRFSDDWWQPQLEICLLGCLLRVGWWLAFEAVEGDTTERRALFRNELRWWERHAMVALEYL